MLTVDSRDEEALRLLVMDPGRPASRSAQDAARRIRRTFISGLGWGMTELLRYRFRDLLALSEEGQVRLCEVEGSGDWVQRQDPRMVHLLLSELRDKTPLARERMLERVRGEERVKQVLKEKSVALSESEWQYLVQLTGDTQLLSRKTRETPRELGSAILALVRNAYGQRGE